MRNARKGWVEGGGGGGEGGGEGEGGYEVYFYITSCVFQTLHIYD